MSIIQDVFGSGTFSLGASNLTYSAAAVILGGAVRKPIGRLATQLLTRAHGRALEDSEKRVMTHVTTELAKVHDRLDQQAEATRVAAAVAPQPPAVVHHPPHDPEGM